MHDVLTHGNFDSSPKNIPRLSYFQLNKIHFIIRHSQNLYEILLYKRYTIEKNPTQQHIYPLNQCDVYTKTTPVNPPPPHQKLITTT